MTSTLPRGTARESTLVLAIKADYPPMFDDGPLPDSLTTLLLAKCDPNIMGTPPLLPLGAAIRRGEERTVELLLQYQADPQLREHAQEVPLLIAIAKGASKDCLIIGWTRVPQNICPQRNIPCEVPVKCGARQSWK